MENCIKRLSLAKLFAQLSSLTESGQTLHMVKLAIFPRSSSAVPRQTQTNDNEFPFCLFQSVLRPVCIINLIS